MFVQSICVPPIKGEEEKSIAQNRKNIIGNGMLESFMTMGSYVMGGVMTYYGIRDSITTCQENPNMTGLIITGATIGIAAITGLLGLASYITHYEESKETVNEINAIEQKTKYVEAIEE
jgi:hypothetical protein